MVFIIFLVLFFLLFPKNISSVGQNCTCVIGTDPVSQLPACVDSSPSSCPPGETCKCNAQIEPSSGVIISCDPGTCVLSPASTPTSASTGGIQPTECDTAAGPKTGIMTALGCIPTKDTAQFVGWLLGSAIKIAGGIAFLLIIFGAIKILTSAGNPENVKAGQELITSAIMGLLFIIFSLFLLELIGVKILNIPGFSKP